MGEAFRSHFELIYQPKWNQPGSRLRPQANRQSVAC
jgi:hypothetical protein